MPLRFTVVHGETYSTVTLAGDPPLDQFLELVETLGRESKSWPHPCGLFDMRQITTLRGLNEHVAIGQAVAQHLRHFAKIASVVPPDRVTGISRQEARSSGTNLMVFIDFGQAAEWLLS